MQVTLIEVFGQQQYQKGGANVAFIPEKTIAELRYAIDKLAKIRLILGESDKVITAMHETRRFDKTQYVA